MLAMARTLRGQGRAATEQNVKDLIKIAKSALSDKVLMIRDAAAQV